MSNLIQMYSEYVKPEKEQTHKTVKKNAFFINLKDLSNKQIVERWLATGLITDGESAMDVADKLSKYDPKLSEFMKKVVEQNIKRKRWGGKKNPYMTWKDPITDEMVTNPKEYLEKISDYIMRKVNSPDKKEWYNERTEVIETFFWVTEKTKVALVNLLSFGSYTGFNQAIKYLESNNKFEKLLVIIKKMHEQIWNGRVVVAFSNRIKEWNKEELKIISEKLRISAESEWNKEWLELINEMIKIIEEEIMRW